RGGAPRPRRQDDDEGKGRGAALFPQLLEQVRLAVGARFRRGPAGGPRLRSGAAFRGAALLRALALGVGSPPVPPRFSVRARRDGGRGDAAALSAIPTGALALRPRARPLPRA